jgi:hypothetical protein
MVQGSKFPKIGHTQLWAGLKPTFKYRLPKNWLGSIRDHPTYQMAVSAFRRIELLGARNTSSLFVAKNGHTQLWAGLTPTFKYRLLKNWLGSIREYPTYQMAVSAFRRIELLGARNASSLFVPYSQTLYWPMQYTLCTVLVYNHVHGTTSL